MRMMAPQKGWSEVFGGNLSRIDHRYWMGDIVSDGSIATEPAVTPAFLCVIRRHFDYYE
jgi:hypothetical protein